MEVTHSPPQTPHHHHNADLFSTHSRLSPTASVSIPPTPEISPLHIPDSVLNYSSTLSVPQGFVFSRALQIIEDRIRARNEADQTSESNNCTVRSMAPTEPKPINAKNMNVYISGIKGLHPIRTGLAYFYRGHYLYDENCIPIVPVVPARKEPIVKRILFDETPCYDARDATMKSEIEIAGLYRSMLHEWKTRPKEYGSTEGETKDIATKEQATGAGRLEPTVAEQGVQGACAPKPRLGP